MIGTPMGNRFMLLGAFAVGKTTAIEAMQGRRLDVSATGEAATPTGPATDTYAAELDADTPVVLGEPARGTRLDRAWRTLVEQFDGGLLLINHNTADRTSELERFLARLRGARERTRPVVIGVTHLDHLPQLPLAVYEQYILETNHGCNCPRCTPPVLGLDARVAHDVRAALVTLGAVIEMAQRYPQAACRA